MSAQTTNENEVMSPTTTSNEGETPRPTIKTPVYCQWCEVFICCKSVKPEDNGSACDSCVYGGPTSTGGDPSLIRRRGLPRCFCVIC